MKKVIKYVLNGFAILFFALTAYIIIATVGALAQNKQANIFGYSMSVVATDSMEDTIMVGDFVIYDYRSYDELEVGDIVVFDYIGSNSLLQGKKIVHRIYEELPNGDFITRGDHYDTSDDDPLNEDNYIGKVVLYTSFFGLGKLRLNSLGIFFAIVMAGFLFLIILEIRNFTKNYRKLLAEERAKKEKENEEKE